MNACCEVKHNEALVILPQALLLKNVIIGQLQQCHHALADPCVCVVCSCKFKVIYCDG